MNEVEAQYLWLQRIMYHCMQIAPHYAFSHGEVSWTYSGRKTDILSLHTDGTWGMLHVFYQSETRQISQNFAHPKHWLP